MPISRSTLSAFGGMLALACGMGIGRFACVLEAIGVAASVEWNSTRGLFLSAVLLGGTFMGITALGFMAMRSISGNQSQRMMGLLTSSFAVGQIIGPLFAGHLFELAGSFRSPSLVASTVLVCAAALALSADTTPDGQTQTAISLKKDDRS